MKVILSKQEVVDILLSDETVKAVFGGRVTAMKVTMSPTQVTIEEVDEDDV